MRHYLARWYDGCGRTYYEFDAENITEATGIAFRKMCDTHGDLIWDVEVFEARKSINCDGEMNPSPRSSTHEYAVRDYETGKKVRR